MSNKKTCIYRVVVAVAFGLIGFGVNFLDIVFMEGAPFTISILAGLFFPLVVALAWGWRYGFLSALAGGCQSLWWLWHGDGWGVLYSVPVFTLWIVWHGWWAERQVEGSPWYVSSFAVEIPVRITIELGFLVVFRWLVSFNPPPWNPAIAWDHVSSAWLQTVAVKHLVEAYVLLMAAYVALSLGPIRRFFGLPPRFAQGEILAIYAGAALFGLLLWVLDALVEYFVFPSEGQTFWGIVVQEADAHEVFMRFVYVTVSMLAGIVLARLHRRHEGLRELLNHRNRALSGIRTVNQHIVREKDPICLLDEACRLLVETQGHFNVWIVLTTDGHPVEPFFHAGFNGGFAPMAERLRSGDLPLCAQAALSSGGVQVKSDPLSQCMACPLASKCAGRAGLSLRLEHAGRVFGWMSLSCLAMFARSTEEHDLLKEVAGDIAFALWVIENETQRATLAHKYAAVLATTTDAVVAGDLDGRITVFNPGAEKLFGCSVDEALGSSLTRFCPEDRLEEQAEMLRRVRDTGGVAAYKSERLTAGGRRIPVEISLGLNTDDQGRPLGINAVLRDITERKRAEEALIKSEWYLRSTLDGLLAHIVVLDDQGDIILTNKAYRDFAEQNGIDPSAVSEGVNYLASCDTASGVHSEEAKPFAEGVREVISGKRLSFELEYPCHSPEEKRWFIARVTPFVGKGPRRVVVAHENITARKEAEAKIIASMDAAEKANKTKSEFLANMSHEIRTPMNGIVGMLQLLQTTELNNEQKEYALMAIQSSQRLTRLLSDILDLSRIEAGKLVVLEEPFLISETIRSVEQLFLPVSRQTGIVLHCHIDERIHGTLLGDTLRLQQVLNNLVANAFKFTASGSITLEVYPLPRAHGRQVRILFSVSDTGCGIPDHKQGMLFDAFTQASEGFTRTHQGAGLGLTICRQLVGLMGGNISLDSEEVRGTTIHFCATFGLAETSVPALRVAGSIGEKFAKGLRILLAEDDRVSRLSAQRQLEKFGCAVTAVENGREALEALRQGEYDVVLMDVQMPTMDGVEATLAIRAGEAGADRADIPVIALTAYAMAGDRDRLLAAGMDDYVAKPVDMDELTQAIKRVMGG